MFNGRKILPGCIRLIENMVATALIFSRFHEACGIKNVVNKMQHT